MTPRPQKPFPLSPDTNREYLRQNILSGTAYAQQKTDEMDTLICTLAKGHLPADQGIALLALGGYGRAELCPGSDIDLMILTQETATKTQQDAIEKMLYALWDMGLKIGHSTRSLKDCADVIRQDHKTLTSLLDARLIWGDQRLQTTLEQNLDAALKGNFSQKFVQYKLQERTDRLARFADARYVLEPNIKEGKGALRDYQTLLWITRALFGTRTLNDLVTMGVLTDQEGYRFQKAHGFLMTVRCHLHDLAGRADDRLHFDIQPDIARRLGYADRPTGRAVERFMKHYFLVARDIGTLTRLVFAAIETKTALKPHAAKPMEEFTLHGHWLDFRRDPQTPIAAYDLLRLFYVAQQNGVDIHPHALRDITRNTHLLTPDVLEDERANACFLDILLSPYDPAKTLRKMADAGVLGRFIPAFGRIIGLMQFDQYHYFTVDEHSLRCIDMLRALERVDLIQEAPIASAIIPRITDRTALFVAMFLHDLCKGRGGRHAQLGAELAITLGPRLGLSGGQTDLISWLVFDHLLMSDTAFKRNLNDPKTIADFSAKVRTQSRLDLLFILTTADIMGVGPERWTAWKARLLEELYTKTSALLAGEEPGMTTEITLPADYQKGETRIVVTTDEAQSASVVIVYTPDKPGLFATLCGALSAEGASIMRAYIATLPGFVAVDRFIIQNASGLPFHQVARQNDLKESLLAALAGTLDIPAKIAAYKKPITERDRVFDIPTRVDIHNDASGSDTVVELEARDRHGLLYDIACALRDEGLDLRAAKVNTQGLRVLDAFYLQTGKRKKLTDPALQARLIDALKRAVAKP